MTVETNTGGTRSRARRVTAILTAHNRREPTLACLRSYFSQDAPGTALRAVVIDDGSSDGTADAVLTSFPAAEVSCAVGDLFWARGMATAEAVAMPPRPDFLLWLNADVYLYPGALRRLLLADRPAPDISREGARLVPEAAPR